MLAIVFLHPDSTKRIKFRPIRHFLGNRFVFALTSESSLCIYRADNQKVCVTGSEHTKSGCTSLGGAIMSRWTIAVTAGICLSASALVAQEYVTEAKASFIFNGERIKISRENREVARYAERFAAAGGRCGAPCIVPSQVADGVKSLDETEVLEFLVTQVAGNAGLMVDARMPDARAQGFIPGTVSLPHPTLSPENAFRKDILRALGVREFDGVFNFTDARKLLVYDNGPSTDDAGTLVRHLLNEGYPADLIHYYRGGMRVWAVLGFSIEEGTS